MYTFLRFSSISNTAAYICKRLYITT